MAVSSSELAMTKVLKRNGSIEDFDANKIAKVTKAAGLESHEAEELAARIAVWVKEKGQDQITSFQIRIQVIEELKKINQYVANLFTWYQKTKNHNLNPQRSIS